MNSFTNKNIKNWRFKRKLNNTNCNAKYLRIELKICKQSPLEKAMTIKIKLNSTKCNVKYLRIKSKICKQSPLEKAMTVKIKLVKLNLNMKSVSKEH